MAQKKNTFVLDMTSLPAKGSPNFACVPGLKERINGMKGISPFTKVTMGVLETHLDWSMKLASLLNVPKVILIPSKDAICEDKVEMINGRSFRYKESQDGLIIAESKSLEALTKEELRQVLTMVDPSNQVFGPIKMKDTEHPWALKFA
jgi:hypothetical protein